MCLHLCLCFISYFGIYAGNSQKRLDICAGSRHFMSPFAHVCSYPLEYMHSYPVRQLPLYFGLCVKPSLYVLMLRAKSRKRLNIYAGLTKPYLFAYPLIGIINVLLVPSRKKLTLLHTLYSHKLISTFVVRSVSARSIKIFHILSTLKLSLDTYFLHCCPVLCMSLHKLTP